MRFVLAVSLALLAIALAMQTSWPQFLYGEWLDPTASIDLLGLSVPFGLGYLLLVLHWLKVVSLAAAAELRSRGHSFGSFFAAVVFVALTLVSIVGNLGHQSIQRDAFARKAKQRKSVKPIYGQSWQASLSS